MITVTGESTRSALSNINVVSSCLPTSKLALCQPKLGDQQPAYFQKKDSISSFAGFFADVLRGFQTFPHVWTYQFQRTGLCIVRKKDSEK